jgi:hypothetical protein
MKNLKSQEHQTIELEMRKICQEYKIDSCAVTANPLGYDILLTKGSRETKYKLHSGMIKQVTSVQSYVRNLFNEKAYSWVVER